MINAFKRFNFNFISNSSPFSFQKYSLVMNRLKKNCLMPIRKYDVVCLTLLAAGTVVEVRLHTYHVRGRGFVPRSGVQVSSIQNTSFPRARRHTVLWGVSVTGW